MARREGYLPRCYLRKHGCAIAAAPRRDDRGRHEQRGPAAGPRVGHFAQQPPREHDAVDGSSAATTLAVAAVTRARLAMYSVCASAVQTTASTAISNSERQVDGPPARPATIRWARRTARQPRSARAPSSRAGAAPARARAHRHPREREPRQDAPASPRSCRSAQRNSGTSSSETAGDERRLRSTRCAARNRRAAARSSNGTNSGKLAKPSRPIATVDTWIAAKNATQCTARSTPLPAIDRGGPRHVAWRQARQRTPAPAPRGSCGRARSPPAFQSIHLPNRPAKPNSATATCSAPEAAAGDRRRRRRRHARMMPSWSASGAPLR